MNKIFNELEKYCDKHSVKLQIDEFPKDKNRFEITLDNFIYEELSDIRNIIRDFAKIEDDVHLAGNGRAIDIYIEDLNESKSMKESVRFDYDEYIGIHSSVVDDYYIFSYAPIDYDDLSGWEITDVDGNLYIRESWEDMSDKEIADSISKFEKLVKKYTDGSDAKVIIKDFHEKIGM